ncbi:MULTISPECIES: MgtC/SapB family protein [Flavobacteriaceae]|jgi:putative Mg2+ transporter-C (MgtC) family protein|uniref:MgtC/SapB family protein n=1 Tax=Flavobacteriaceae TaxID=49546 RepID=UPI000555DDE6|nr:MULTISPECIES: MgtC/SapB family protein [Flavobacteriaceae]|tara:strand:- start:1460 stop:1879 length:420 start_codon:yes stop_codon:yes gene_type:complete
MDLETELMLLPRLGLAVFLGVLIGIDRETDGHDAGIRTYAAVCLGAALLTIINTHIEVADQTRIVANIVSGIGFLGAGIIFKDNSKGSIVGLTTAATVWATAGVGISLGFGMYLLSITSTLLIILLLVARKLPYLKNRK